MKMMVDFGKNAPFYKNFAIKKGWKFFQVPASSNVVLERKIMKIYLFQLRAIASS